ncbi:hypothetical protein DL767_011314 [Monosporascus sp. MG133]|nr:hypothetical protein DL767_011314 [Monosporascus sp. MG133]
MLHRIFSPVRPYTCASFCRLNPTILGRILSSKRCKIRMIILSDTHGDDLKDVSLPRADVVLHCGDLTNDSRSADLERTLAMLRAIDAPLKLAIPGNHDFGLGPGYWRRTQARSHPAQQQQHDDGGVPAQASEAEDVDEEDDSDAKASWELLRRAARRDRIFLLPQGTHTFVLPPDAGGAGGGGARLRLFASPLTPRRGNWGFQYDRSNPHKWAIPPTTPNGDGAVDVVMTHSPPRGIRDGTGMGGQMLSVGRVPRSSATCLGPPPAGMTQRHHSPPREEGGCCAVDISPDGEHAVERGAQTLFVNAAVELRSRPPRMPWLVDMDLPVAGEEDAAAAAETMRLPEPQKEKNGKGKNGKRGQLQDNSQNNRSNSSCNTRGVTREEEQFIPEGLRDLYRSDGKIFSAHVNEQQLQDLME